MASTSTIRSPIHIASNLPESYYVTPPSSSTTGISPTLASCPFRRSRSNSRVFYDSQLTTGTSWQFRGIEADSPTPPPHPPHLYQTQVSMSLSVLRSPGSSGAVQVLSPNMNHGLNCSMNSAPMSPSPMMHHHHRSIPSPPTQGPSSSGVKDDLSDGSRNSTGSSTGSHRSQDSGFSDSGEAHLRPSRRSLAIASPHPNRNNTDNSPSLQLQHSQILAAVSRCNNNNVPCDCSTVIGVVDNGDKNHNSSNSGTVLGQLCHHSSFNRARNSVTFVRSPPAGPPPNYSDVVQPIYSQNMNYVHPNVHHHSLDQQERLYSTTTPVLPSPIPHSGSGCGKLTMGRNGSTFTLPLKYPGQTFTTTTKSQSEYGEVNGVTETCSNYIYQEITPSQQQQLSPSLNTNHLHLHPPHPIYQSSQNARLSGSGGETGNYAYYSTISPSSTDPNVNSRNAHFGAPICSSTPKRSNLSTSQITVNPTSVSSSSRLGAMQKIDNFTTLNKNQRHSLDNNNNSSNNGSNSNSATTPTSSSGANKEIKSSPRNLNYQFLTCTPKPSSSSTNTVGNASSSNSRHEKSPSVTSTSKTSNKKHPSKLSLLSSLSASLSSSSSHQNQSSHSTPNANKTVVVLPQRGPLPLPPVPETVSTSPTVKNNSFTTTTSSSHSSQLKSCIKSSNNTSNSISPKWKNLPKGYKRVSTRDLAASFTTTEENGHASSYHNHQNDQTSPDGVIVVKSHFENDSMRQWLHDLRSQTENECFYMLQTKSIISEEDQGNVDNNANDMVQSAATNGGAHASDSDSGTYGSQGSGSSSVGKMDKGGKKWSGKSVVEAIHNISAPLMSIKNVEQMANVVSAEFAKICKNIEFGFLSQVPRLVLNLVTYVESFLQTFAGTGLFGNLQKLENKLSRSCRRLHRSAQIMLQISSSSTSEYGQQPVSVHSIIESESLKKGEGYHVAVSEVVDGIVTVGNLFSQVVDLRLTRDLSCILDTVEGGGVPAKVALKSFANILMDGGNHLCRLASEIRTVRGMLGVILDAKEDYLRILSLRCLATVLCVGEAVKDFDRASGFEIVADFMYEPMYSFDLKIEAVSVLTQATDPWIDLETSLCTLESNLEKIVVALTNLIPACKSSEEPFLLVVAAISNLTFLEVSSIPALRRCDTISFILNVIETTGSKFSVFVLDHVATILANMAGVESCRDCIVKSGGIHALLKFLHKKPTPALESAAEIMACERVQQKSTIAISRLCTEEGVAQLIMERGGLHRLIQLSRNEKERNYSDGVLIAALATLRKLVSICGDEGIRGQQADDLIQPRLLDSFLLYSSRQESYV